MATQGEGPAAAADGAAGAPSETRFLARSLGELQAQLDALSEAQQARIMALLEGHVTDGDTAFEVNLRSLPLAKFRELTRRVAQERRDAAEEASTSDREALPPAEDKGPPAQVIAAAVPDSGSPAIQLRARVLEKFNPEEQKLLTEPVSKQMSGHKKKKRKALMDTLTYEEHMAVIGVPEDPDHLWLESAKSLLTIKNVGKEKARERSNLLEALRQVLARPEMVTMKIDGKQVGVTLDQDLWVVSTSGLGSNQNRKRRKLLAALRLVRSEGPSADAGAD